MVSRAMPAIYREALVLCFVIHRLYHVWTEAWMRRGDLPLGYDGWQVLDACSSEKLGGTQRIGPCSVVAVKEGLSGKQWPYDGEFVLSEISSEIRYHRVMPTAGNIKNSKCALALVQQGQVGLKIITATPKRGTFADITANYRNELIAHVMPANTTPVKTKNCTFELCTSDEAALGDNITLNIKIYNSGALMRTVDGRVVGKTVDYTGAAVKNFMSMEFAGVVAPGKGEGVCMAYVSCLLAPPHRLHGNLAHRSEVIHEGIDRTVPPPVLLGGKSAGKQAAVLKAA